MRHQEHSLAKPTTKSRLCRALADRLSEIEQTCIQWVDIELFPARGYWRHTKADVQQFTGSVNINGFPRSIGCWESMSDCLRFGFDIEVTGGGMREYNYYDVSARGHRVDRAAALRKRQDAHRAGRDDSDDWYSGFQLEEIAYAKATGS